MKKLISGIIIGAVLGTAIGGFAVNSIVDNPFPVVVNGEKKNIEGYNIDDRTYFKLRDIADAVGGFSVDFKDNTILIDTEGAAPAQTATAAPEAPVPETSVMGQTERKDALDAFLKNDFENATVVTQVDQTKSIAEDDTQIACKNKTISNCYADIDSDGYDELVIFSEAAPEGDYEMNSNKCISIWDCGDNGSVTKLVAKIGLASRTSYRYSVISHKDREYLVEAAIDGNNEYKTGEIKILDCKNGEFVSVHKLSYSEDGSKNVYTIDGSDVSKDELDTELDGIENAIIYSPYSE